MLDVGGGPGVYAGLLVDRGYRVRLLDVLPLHVEQAQEHGTFEARLGDARQLEEEDGTWDAVLLLGPLYHLTERKDRVRALSEARRVLRPGGVVIAAAISRFASLLDGLRQRFFDEPFDSVIERDLREGQHRNPAGNERPEWFTTSYFHHPDELAAEVAESGLAVEALLGVEGPAWLFDDVPEEIALRAARAVEAEPALLAASSHLLIVARK